jgi:hypothetical protein
MFHVAALLLWVQLATLLLSSICQLLCLLSLSSPMFQYAIQLLLPLLPITLAACIIK